MKYGLKKRKGNFIFFIILFFFAGGYLIFFSSTVWMPAGSAADLLSAPGEDITWQDRTFTIFRWEYEKEGGVMEVELDVENNAFDGQDLYEFEAADRMGDELTVVPVIEEPDWIVLRIEGVDESFSEMSLRVRVAGAQSQDPLRLYTNANDVDTVSVLDKKSRAGYKKERIVREIEKYKEQIQEKEKKIESLTGRTNQMEEEINRLSQEAEYQTEEQRTESSGRMDDIRAEINSNQEEIQKLTAEIQELNKRISLAEEQMKQFS